MNDRYDPVEGLIKFSGMPICSLFSRIGFGTCVDLLTSVKNTKYAPVSAEPHQRRIFVQNRKACIVEVFTVILLRLLSECLPNEKKNVVKMPLYTEKAVYL